MYYVSKNGTGFYVDDESQLDIYNQAGYEIYELTQKPINNLAKERIDESSAFTASANCVAPEPVLEDQ